MSISFVSMMQAIQARLNTLVIVPNSLEVRWPNAPVSDVPEGVLWLKPHILPGENLQVENGLPGSNVHRTAGVLMVGIFVPLEVGEAAGYAVADLIAGAFNSISTNGPDIVYGAVTVQAIGRDKNWWRLDVTCPFQYDAFA